MYFLNSITIHFYLLFLLIILNFKNNFRNINISAYKMPA